MIVRSIDTMLGKFAYITINWVLAQLVQEHHDLMEMYAELDHLDREEKELKAG